MDDAWRARILARFGPGVAGWLDALPARLRAVAREWDLSVGEALASGSTSAVLACTIADGTPAVLKLSPEPELVAAETAALTAWAATGVTPRLLRRAGDALLLERIQPGTRLVDRPQPAALSDIAATVAALHRPAPAGFAPLIERLRFIYALAARRGIDPALVARGLEAAERLAASYAGPPRLLHGDLHAGNVLDGGGRGLVVIDPRACVGDPAFDFVDWVLYDGDPRERVAQLAAGAGLDAERLLAWTRATAVLAGPAVRGRPGGEARVAAFLPAP